jgi:hypothetical protein
MSEQHDRGMPEEESLDQETGPWSELTDDLLGLTDKLRITYRRALDESGPSEDQVREAFRTLAGAWNQLAGSVGTAIQDPEVKRHLKKAASSLVNAVGASLSELIPAPDEDTEGDTGKDTDGERGAVSTDPGPDIVT